jgi:hypothetical protein
MGHRVCTLYIGRFWCDAERLVSNGTGEENQMPIVTLDTNSRIRENMNKIVPARTTIMSGTDFWSNAIPIIHYLVLQRLQLH